MHQHHLSRRKGVEQFTKAFYHHTNMNKKVVVSYVTKTNYPHLKKVLHEVGFGELLNQHEERLLQMFEELKTKHPGFGPLGLVFEWNNKDKQYMMYEPHFEGRWGNVNARYFDPTLP